MELVGGELNRLLSQLPGTDPVAIDTVMRPGNDAARIERQFEDADIVLTPRLHGSLYARAKGKLVIAIDQINGTGKVKPLLDRIGWPFGYSIEEVNEALLADAMGRIRAKWPVEAVAEAQKAILELSAKARADAVGLIGKG
ncbi:hypothetical protein [Mesorhizobium sp.]|uniref:hypothetical protein n=1 Tax=Mesorhizobium sp. TaxID=1871066 RepID=UPI0025F5B043|nr:hypothetical protein [Mesorhizobium sp.]